MYIFNVDDYGFFKEQSKRILSCIENGVVNAVSIMPNSPNLKDCMEMMLANPYTNETKITIHLNMLEGRCLSDPSDIPNLIGDDRILNSSFKKLLIASYNPFVRNEYRKELFSEIDAQIKAGLPYSNLENGLRIDSHSHFHMIPVMFDALMDVIKANNYKIEYIRMPREDVSIYREANQHPRFINQIKVLVLNTLYRRNYRKYKSIIDSFSEHALYLGVMQSGNMFYKNVSALLPIALRKAKEANCGFEMAFHTGRCLEEDDLKAFTFPDDVTFTASADRDAEAEATIRLKKDFRLHCDE